jgi:hypothetical protein
MALKAPLEQVIIPGKLISVPCSRFELFRFRSSVYSPRIGGPVPGTESSKDYVFALERIAGLCPFQLFLQKEAQEYRPQMFRLGLPLREAFQVPVDIRVHLIIPPTLCVTSRQSFDVPGVSLPSSGRYDSPDVPLRKVLAPAQSS